MALRAGQGHLLNLFRGSNTDLKSQLAKDGWPMLPYTHGQGVYTLMPDTIHPDSPLANQKVREATEYALDKEAICKVSGNGLWNPVWQSTSSGTAYYNPSIVARKFDLAKAKSLLAEAGYTAAKPLSFTLYALQSDGVLSQQLQAMWKDAGINVTISSMDQPTWSKYMGDPNGWSNGYYISALPTQPFAPASFQRHWGTPATVYAGAARPKELTDAFNTLLATTDMSKIGPLAQQVVKISYDMAVIIPVFEHEADWNIDSKHLKDPGLNVVNYWDSANAWLAK